MSMSEFGRNTWVMNRRRGSGRIPCVIPNCSNRQFGYEIDRCGCYVPRRDFEFMPQPRLERGT